MARRTIAARIALVLALTIGLAIGLGAFTFVYARGYSYLSNDPAACANCHIMREHFDAWNKSSHKNVRIRFSGAVNLLKRLTRQLSLERAIAQVMQRGIAA